MLLESDYDFYRRCDKCSRVLEITQANRGCSCGNSYNADKWMFFPSENGARFIYRVLNKIYTYETPVDEEWNIEEKETSCLLLCAIFEMLLTAIIRSLLEKRGDSEADILSELHKNQGKDRRIRLFKIITQKSMACTMDHHKSNFYTEMSQIFKWRDQYIHGGVPTPAGIEKIDDDALQNLVIDILEVFIAVNNDALGCIDAMNAANH